MDVVEIRQLTRRFGEVTALGAVDLTIAEGEILGLVGPNGAGKSTLVDCVVGLQRPDDGRVRVLGRDPVGDAAYLRTVVGVQLQAGRLPERIRVGEALALFGAFHDDPVPVDRLAADWGLGELLRREYRHLSGGEQQRLAIALALIGRPRLIVLDELTTGLDPEGRRSTWRHVEAVRSSGVTVLLVTHFMDEAERLCDRIAVLDHGRLVAVGTAEELAGRAAAGAVRLVFRPSGGVDDAELLALAGVRSVERRGPRIAVLGDASMPDAVTSYLALVRIEAVDLRLEQPDLEDTYLALTGGIS